MILPIYFRHFVERKTSSDLTANSQSATAVSPRQEIAMPQTYTASITVTSEMISDQIVTAIEGGSNYWLGGIKLIHSEVKDLRRPWYSDHRVFENDFIILVKELEEHIKGRGTETNLTPDAIRAGLTAMAVKHSSDLSDILGEAGDADTADTFLQFCLFGKLIYG
jgi:hypothetical protein